MNVIDLEKESALVLVVDDNKFMRIQIRRAMEQAGYQVVEAFDTEQALAIYTRLHPDIVLLSALMPVMDGFTCCTQLQTLPRGERTPVLMITALEDQESVERAFEAGATDYVTKPIHARVLLQKVRRLLQASRAIEELSSSTERALISEEQLRQSENRLRVIITERRRAEEELKRQNLRSQLFADVTLKIRQSLQIDKILQTTVKEVQKLLQADRVLIYRLWPDGTGTAVTEAMVPGFQAILNQTFPAEVFPEEYRQLYTQGRMRVIENLAKAEVPSCLVEFLQPWAVKAKLVVPILLKAELWGLLIAHQCSSPRQWSSFETEILQQLSDQISIALTQAQMLEEETRYSQELARSNAELQQFASIASHDLQEPLRKIQAFANRLNSTCGDALTDPGRDYLERIQNAAERMQALIDDLLTLSRITTRAQPFVLVNLASVTQEVLSDLEVLIQQTGGSVFVGDLPTINADPIQMRQLLQNLIGNALKFHSDNEPPVVKIYSQFLGGQERQPSEDSVGQANFPAAPRQETTAAESCQLIVEDNGIGFDEKYLDRIFNVFQRLHSRSDYEGTGMGLAICRKIAERHGGSIAAKSTPGRGATFMVTLPIKFNP